MYHAFGVLLDPLTMRFTHVISGEYLQNRTPLLSTSVRSRSFIAQKASHWLGIIIRQHFSLVTNKWISGNRFVSAVLPVSTALLW